MSELYVVKTPEGNEKIKGAGLIMPDSDIVFVTGTPSPIKSSDKGDPKFANSGKVTWINSLKVKYQNDEMSENAYVNGVAISMINHSPKMDFMYIGIPSHIVSRIQRDAGVDVAGALSNGFLWVTTKIVKFEHVSIMNKAGKQQTPAVHDFMNLMRTKKINPVGMGVLSFRLKCTCDVGVGLSEVMTKQWQIGATLTNLIAIDRTEHCNPSAFTVKTKAVVGVPKIVKDLVTDTFDDMFEDDEESTD